MTPDAAPSREVGPVGAEEAYEDVDPEEAVWLGVLSELTAIRGELVAIRRALVDAPAAEPESGWRCEDCGDTFADDADARDHAVREHGAPTNAWDYRMEALE